MTGASDQTSPLSVTGCSGAGPLGRGVWGSSAAIGGEKEFSKVVGSALCVSSNPPDCAKPGRGDVRNWKETGCKE